MRLTHARVKNFRCVLDSEEFTVDQQVTCLVGKNESGKTAVLHALTKIMPIDGSSIGPLSDLDLPRYQMGDLGTKNKTEGVDAVVTKWELLPEDLAKLQVLVGPSSCAKEFGVTLKYDNARYYDFEIDESKVAAFWLAQHSLPPEEHQLLAEAKNVQDLRSALKGISDPTQRQKDLLLDLNSTFGEKSAWDVVTDKIDELMPRFAYFSEYARMPGRLSIVDFKRLQQTKQLPDGYRVFDALLRMIGKTVADLEDVKQFEYLKAALETAEAQLTRQIFAYWSQNRYLKVDFDCRPGLERDPAPFNSGLVLHTRILNQRHGSTTSFDDRSAGFVWFFSFLVWFSQVKKNYGENVIILLDEPGLSLHAKAQADLLRYIEKELAPHYQVLYSTHSPFMIDPANLLRARTVEDVFIEPKSKDPMEQGELLGTKIGSDVLSTDKDTLFPLQACLGYEITQTLFVGKHTLLVEGPSDLLFLQWFKRRLAVAGRTTLDQRWTITPCGGIDKVAAFMALFAGNNLHIAVLTDYATGNKKKVQALRESKLLLEGHVLTAEAYAAKPEADIEDIVGSAPYADLVNKTFGLTGAQVFKIPSALAQQRAVKLAEEHFLSFPVGGPEFDHYQPAEALITSDVGGALIGLNDGLNRFERLFADLNALLAADTNVPAVAPIATGRARPIVAAKP